VNKDAGYMAAVGIDEVMRGLAAGDVIASRHPGYAEGDLVMESTDKPVGLPNCQVRHHPSWNSP
jgi:NADPH-dependent curcumin reductase CurA